MSNVDESFVPPAGGPVSGGVRVPVSGEGAVVEWEHVADATARQDAGERVTEDDIPSDDLDSVNKDLVGLRVRMAHARRGQRDASRRFVDAKVRYERAYRRALIKQSGGNVESRRAHAEIECEDLESEYLVAQQVLKEFDATVRNVRDDIENAKTVAYNLRTLMSIN